MAETTRMTLNHNYKNCQTTTSRNHYKTGRNREPEKNKAALTTAKPCMFQLPFKVYGGKITLKNLMN